MAPELNEIAKRHLRRPVTVKIGLSSPSDIRQTVVVVESAQRQSRFLASLREVLEVTTDPLVLVFMNARHEVENLSYTLSEEGISCDFMHGGLTQVWKRAFLAFRGGFFFCKTKSTHWVSGNGQPYKKN